jgi:hypothetical protein
MNETNTYNKLKGKPQNNFPEYIIIHNSGGTDKYPLMDTSNHTAKDMEAWHLSKGWDGLGYHYVIHKDGEVWKGRPETYNGAHCVGYNDKSIGICLSGNFDATNPTEAQEKSLVLLIRDIQTRYPNIKFAYHRDFAKKTCPGNNITDDWLTLLLVKGEEMVSVPKSLLLELKKYI